MAARSFFKYLKRAFLYHWNVLAVAAGAAVGFISGHPDVVLPLVAAGEVVYLAGLCTHPRFQQAIDAEEHKEHKKEAAARTAERGRVILESLGDEDRQRFEKLRGLCFHLRRISQGVKGDAVAGDGLMDDMQASGVNKLLWIYLKLLYSKSALEKFFQTIDEQEIERHVERARKRLEELGPAEQDSPPQAQRRKSLQDTLDTSEARLINYRRAVENHEFIELELDRLYTKIASLGEMGINRQDANFITREVDSVSASVAQTEKAMNELEFLSGLDTDVDHPPELLGVEGSDETELFES
ncbi:MAG: hypothetical protein JXR96_30370 [Deltaproteobacteria bacterium]|nr:hypothetical protein [Deltaproteobacteria bacterium]